MRSTAIAICLLLSLASFSLMISGQTENKGQRYALIIGIKGYPRFPLDEKLQYADADAQRFYDFILSPSGGDFPKDNVRLLLNGNADRAAIFREINWLSNRVGSRDLIYIFFAGHGIVDTYNRAYLMPYDADKKSPDDKGIRADMFLQDIRTKIDAKQTIFFIDACHAGAAVVEGGTARDVYPNVTVELRNRWEKIFNKQGSISMGLLSASSNQRSWEDRELQQGLFTYFLIKGLKGSADRNHDNVVTAGEIHRYVLDNVSDMAERKFHSPQTPIPSPKFDSEFPLSIITPEIVFDKNRLITGRIEAKQSTIGIIRENDNIRTAPGYEWVNPSDPKDLSVRLKQGLARDTDGSFRPVNNAYEWVNPSDPKDYSVRLKQGLTKTADGFRLANNAYEWVNPSDPKDYSVRLKQGLARDTDGIFRPVNNAYEWVNPSDPKDYSVRLKRGLIKTADGFRLANNAYEWVNPSDPKDYSVRLKRGLIKTADGFRLAPGYRWVNPSDKNDYRVEPIH